MNSRKSQTHRNKDRRVVIRGWWGERNEGMLTNFQ
jgi:hypothetical protein